MEPHEQHATSGAAAAPFTIVAAVDLSSISEIVFDHALDTASRHSACDLHVISVVPMANGLLHHSADPGLEIQEVEHILRERLAAPVANFARTAGRTRSWQLRVHVRAGEPAEEITSLANEVDADLVVLGRHGWGGRRRYLVGSVSERVLRLARSSVLLVQPADRSAHGAAAEHACPDCVATRRDSHGERWHCERHAGDHRGRALTFLMPGNESALRPGGLF